MLIGDFKIGAKLGQGTFSKVCQGVHLPTGEKVAIKILSKDQIKEKLDLVFGDTNDADNNYAPKYNPNIDRFKDSPAYVIGGENNNI